MGTNTYTFEELNLNVKPILKVQVRSFPLEVANHRIIVGQYYILL